MILFILLETLSPYMQPQYAIAPAVIAALIGLAGTGTQVGVDANTKKKLAKLSTAEAAALEQAMKAEKDAAKRQQMLVDAANRADRKSRFNIIVGVSAVLFATFGAFYFFRKKK